MIERPHVKISKSRKYNRSLPNFGCFTFGKSNNCKRCCSRNAYI